MKTRWPLIGVLALGLVIRLVLIGNEGFKTDVGTFEAWAMSLAEHGFATFYATGGFADYPPGYFYILAAVGHLWEALFKSSDRSGGALLALVKLPAILADLGVGALIYATVRRFAAPAMALGASALYVLNPAIFYNSAVWGQVDSVAAGFAVLAIYALLRSNDVRAAGVNWWIAGAWVSIAYSLLIKPQAAVILPLMLAFALADPKRLRERAIGSAVGIVAAFVLAIALVEPFHPSDPAHALSWLLGRYSYGSGVYAYNSVNAFNLWAIRGSLWQPDTAPISIFGSLVLGPQYLWGVILVVAAVALTVWRYGQDRTERSLLEGCAIVTIGFFVLATRMHERYLFDGLTFTIVCLPFARRYLWGALALSLVLFANLQYSLQYLAVMSGHATAANAQNLWGAGTSAFSLLAVGTFFWLGYQYLGGDSDPAPAAQPRTVAATPEPAGRSWFDPRQGLTPLRWPLDYAIAAAFGIGNFVLSFVGYWWPTGTSCWTEGAISRCGIFDELYFARAGEEYLQNLRIYENTHPPLTKLFVTLSMMLFGGMPHGHGVGGWTGLNALIGHMSNGDNPYGWRFLDVVFGALVVMLLFAFAKRVTGSTLFASIAALLLSLDGMHFVQSRIATPEGFVVFFATLATYAFYRFWIASQVGERAHVDVPEWGFAVAAGGAALAGIVVATIGHVAAKFDAATTVVTAIYVGCGAYLVARYLVLPRWFGDGRRELTFAEGSSALVSGDGRAIALAAADGGSIDERGKIARGAYSEARGGALVYDEAQLRIDYRRDATVTYATPDGSATYADDEIRSENPSPERGAASKLWLLLFTVALGLLVGSKWYGVMGFGVSFIVLIAVFAQRYLPHPRPLVWGNPRGFRLDGALVTILFVSATVYGLAWAPDLVRQSPDPNEIHSANDIVYRQYSMFHYHDTLTATHPYSSKWWEWPLDIVPVAYYYQDHRANQQDPHGCCITEVTSMPNPVILWFGLLAVPLVGVLAWRERNKAYALLILTYLLQWLPWMRSPRITFAYHFYVDIPLIALCNAIALQRLWVWGKAQEVPRMRWLSAVAVGGYALLALASFAYFYPILAGHPISWDAWHNRMWMQTWIIGPG